MEFNMGSFECIHLHSLSCWLKDDGSDLKQSATKGFAVADAPADTLSETFFINNGKGSCHTRFSKGDFLFPLPKNISIDLRDLKRGFLYLKAP